MCRGSRAPSFWVAYHFELTLSRLFFHVHRIHPRLLTQSLSRSLPIPRRAIFIFLFIYLFVRLFVVFVVVVVVFFFYLFTADSYSGPNCRYFPDDIKL